MKIEVDGELFWNEALDLAKRRGARWMVYGIADDVYVRHFFTTKEEAMAARAMIGHGLVVSGLSGWFKYDKASE